jgi:hypothetical protein
VLLLSFGTLLGSLLLWVLLYGIAVWLTVLFLSAIHGPEVRRRPAAFDKVFFSAAATLFVLAWIDRRLTPNDLPRDHKSPAEIATDFILAIPRTTLAVSGTLSAWQRLTQLDYERAAALLERIEATGRLPLQSTPLEIPEDAQREKILFALQLTQLVEVRREDREIWLALSPLRPESLQLGQLESGATSPG